MAVERVDAVGDDRRVAVADGDVVHRHAEETRRDLGEGRLQALAVRARPRDYRDLARRLHAHAAALPADDVRGLRRADAGGLDEARESDPEPAVLGTPRALELAEALVVDQRQHAGERGLVPPRVAGEARRRLALDLS